MTETPTCYLAGPVANCQDGGAGWRTEFKQSRPDLDIIDPLDGYNAPLEGLDIVSDRFDTSERDDVVTVSEIVETDKAKLRNSDAVIVGYEDIKSVGTPMEVMWAYERNYPIILWIRDGTDITDISPWYRYHVDGVRGCSNPPTTAYTRGIYNEY